MGENSKISWTTHTFNPVRGCMKVSGVAARAPAAATAGADASPAREGRVSRALLAVLLLSCGGVEQAVCEATRCTYDGAPSCGCGARVCTACVCDAPFGCHGTGELWIIDCDKHEVIEKVCQ